MSLTELDKKIKALRAEIDPRSDQGGGEDLLGGKNGEIPPDKTQDKAPDNTDLGRAYELIATPLVCGGIGLAVDHYADTSPWGFVIGAVLGVLAAFWTIYKASQNIATPLDLKRLQNRKKTGKR